MPGNARLTIIILSIWLTACASMPDHSNTLVFGTETKLAIDVSTSTTSQVPEVTVGYKRTEAVWLPLLANAGQRNARTPATCTNDCMYAGNKDEDTYSVLASFGADFGGEAGLTVDSTQTGTPTKYQNSVSGGIAQYFATGLAARELAKRGGSALVSVQSANVAAAEEKASGLEKQNAAVTKQIEDVKKQIGLEEWEAIATAAAAREKAGNLYVEVILNKLAPNKVVDKTKLTKAADAALQNKDIKALLEEPLNDFKKAKSSEEIKMYLNQFKELGKGMPVNPLEEMHKALSQ